MNSNLIKDIIYGVIIAILLSIQTTQIFAIVTVIPDMIMIVVILHSIYFGETKGVIFGFFMGLLVDTMSGGLFGLSAFVYVFIAWFVAVYKKYIQASEIVGFIIYIVVATLLKYIFFTIFYLIFQKAGLLDINFFLKMLGEAVYTSAFAALFFFGSPLLYKREEVEF
ncbi:MAG: rod shape-determining protein MreD [Spirochaetes bacterium GWF1_51_8]|nr:MAG: rod shape-determining protein MreD [Spirochaetes bacterium GWF1_51_8]